MALTLALVFGVRLRLLPLAVALAATGIVFGGLALVGAPLTMAVIGVLPILIGLAVDYAIQLQSRLAEEGGDVARVARAGAPTIATAALATAAGFAVLVLSPVPMVREFGLLLVVGVPVALACVLLVGVAVWTQAATATRRTARRGTGALHAALRGARELLVENPVTRWSRRRARAGARRTLAAATTHPQRVLGVGLAVAALGWGLDTQSKVESDVQKLVPQDMPALRDLRALEDSTGIGGEVDVVVTATDLTDPAVVQWMARYQDDLLSRYGYSGTTRGCGKAQLCPAFSLPDLFGAGTAAKTQQGIRTLLDAVPAYFSQGVITRDRTTANLAFGIRLMALSEQQRVFDVMRERLKAIPPPKGTRADITGLPVIAADANAKVASHLRRVLTTLAGLLAVGLALLALLRDRRRALVPLVPIALATGWSSLVLFAMQIPLNPMSVTLGALVIAITTEFSVLLSERYRTERRAGHDVERALSRAYRSTGVAVAASGITAIAGFAVLVLSDIRMLRDFGAMTVVDLAVSLLGVLAVLPSVLVLAERQGVALRLPRPRLPGRRSRRVASAEA
jgi:hypothetical protein